MRSWLLPCLVLGAVVGSASSLSCQSDAQEGCMAGAEGCECSVGQCLGGLVCSSGLCVRPAGTDTGTVGESTSASGATSTTDDADSSSSVSADGTETGPGGCQGTDGTVGCPCLAGDDCLGDLTCDSQQTCICLSGTPCGDSDCVEDFQTDNRHCGTCGNACSVFGNTIGACTDGECPPTLSECVSMSDATTCDAICTAQGRTCVAQGCGENGVSWVQYGDDLACENHSPEGTGMTACTDDLSAVVVQDYLRCCCTP